MTNTSPAVAWIESLERNLQQIRLAVFPARYLVEHNEFDESDQTGMLDRIIALHAAVDALAKILDAIDPACNPDPRALDELIQMGRDAIRRARE